MKRREFFKGAGAATVMAATAGTISSCTSENKLKSGEIYHTVQFDLKYPVGSAEAENFIKDGVRILTAVPGVYEFQACRQCSPKNDYQYAFLMKFANQQDFDNYTANPDHCKFVEERWNTEVTRFQEADFQSL